MHAHTYTCTHLHTHMCLYTAFAGHVCHIYIYIYILFALSSPIRHPIRLVSLSPLFFKYPVREKFLRLAENYSK